MSDVVATTPNDPPVTWSDVTRFVRQLSHDLRNHLNAAELQSVFLNELATDAEMKEEIKRLRAMLSETGAALQNLSVALAQPRLNPIPYRASDLVSDIRKKFETTYPDRKSDVEWKIETGDSMLDVDPQLFEVAIMELLENAFRHRKESELIRVEARAQTSEFLLTLREPKAEGVGSTDDWGRRPLGSVGQGHYALGLNRVRMIVEAHSGRFGANFDTSGGSLNSEIVLPLAPAGN